MSFINGFSGSPPRVNKRGVDDDVRSLIATWRHQVVSCIRSTGDVTSPLQAGYNNGVY